MFGVTKQTILNDIAREENYFESSVFNKFTTDSPIKRASFIKFCLHKNPK